MQKVAVEIEIESPNQNKEFKDIAYIASIHTRHFGTLYFHKKIKRLFDKKIFFLRYIVMTFQNI